MVALNGFFAQISVVALIVGTAVGAGLMTLPLLTQGLPLLTILEILVLAAVLMYQAALFWIELGQEFSSSENLSSYVNRYAPYLYWPSKIIYGAFFWTLLAFYLQNIALFLDPFFSNNPHLLLTITATVLVGCYLLLPSHWQGWMNNLSVQIMLLLLLDIFLSGWNSGVTQLPIISDAPFPWHLLVPMMMFFGYHLTIPSLKSYVDNPATLKKLCAISGFFVLILYFCWCLILMGLVQKNGAAFVNVNSQQFLSQLAQVLPQASTVPYSANLFSVLAILTSCFGMALGMRDFLQDVMGHRLHSVYATIFTLLPSILLLCFGKESMILLQYAAHFALFLLLCVPSWLVFCYRKTDRFWPLMFCLMSCSLFILL